MEKINNPQISIVVPVYKVEKYIDRCINSIMDQTFRQFELILVDDGSPDNCGKICDSYVEKFEQLEIRCTVLHKANGGLSSARNAGIEWSLTNSNSEWITFIDSDDWIHPQYLEALFKAASINGVSVAVGKYDRVKEYTDDQLFETNNSIRCVETEKFWVENRTNATVAWGKLYSKQLFSEVQYPVGKYHEDEYVTYRLLFKNNMIATVATPVYHYYVNDDSIMTLNYMKRLPNLRESLEKHLLFFKDSNWMDAYRLELEKYAECISEAIWLSGEISKKGPSQEVQILRIQLRDFLSQYKKMIPFEKRKDIYIAAYPTHKWFIRILGSIKRIIK